MDGLRLRQEFLPSPEFLRPKRDIVVRPKQQHRAFEIDHARLDFAEPDFCRRNLPRENMHRPARTAVGEWRAIGVHLGLAELAALHRPGQHWK
jgi:hypothetical protein